MDRATAKAAWYFFSLSNCSLVMSLPLFKPLRDIALMGTILPVPVPITLKFFPTMHTNGRIKCPPLNQFWMRLPPCPTTGFTAKFPPPPFWKHLHRPPAMAADQRRLLASHPGKMLSPAKTFHRIFRKPKSLRYRAISQTIQSQITNFFFLRLCHIHTSKQKKVVSKTTCFFVSKYNKNFDYKGNLQ